MTRSSSSLLAALLPGLLVACFASVACGGSVDGPAPSGGSNGGTRGTVETDPAAGAAPTNPAAPSQSNGGTAIGGNCTYRDVEGTATVVALDSSVDNTTIGVCHRATTRVSFTFTPNDPSAAKESATELTIGDGESFPTSCLEPAGLKVGATFAITRHDELTGSCSPKTWEIAKTSPVHACECVPCEETGAGGCF